MTPLMFVAARADRWPAMGPSLVDFLIQQGAYLEFTNANKVLARDHTPLL